MALAQAIVLVAGPKPAIVQAVTEPQTDRAEEELVRARVAELVTDQRRGHLAVLARTRSGIVPRHRGLAHLMVGDLAAAAAETTREPAVTEGATAWEAVATAAAEAAASAVAV